jgi:hypothetical protein
MQEKVYDEGSSFCSTSKLHAARVLRKRMKHEGREWWVRQEDGERLDCHFAYNF